MGAATCHSSITTIPSSAASQSSSMATPISMITGLLPSRGMSFLKSNPLISRGSLVYLPTMTPTTTTEQPSTIHHPPSNHRPIYCRSSSFETYKKGLSYYMPHRTVPWVNDVDNPTRSAKVNDIINEIKKFKVRGEGCVNLQPRGPSVRSKSERNLNFSRYSLPLTASTSSHSYSLGSTTSSADWMTVPTSMFWIHAVIRSLISLVTPT